jgi:cytochrome c-type biogenesis protein CcmE
MAEIDSELREALQRAEADAEAQHISTNDLSPPAATSDERRGNVRLLLALLGMSGALLTGAAFAPTEALIYGATVDDLLAQRATAGNKVFTVQGLLVSGTMQYRQSPCEYRFRLAGETQQIAVHFPSCVLNDTIQDRQGEIIEVTAHGTLAPDGHFQAHHVIGKCASKQGYQPRTGTRAPLIAPARID